MSTQKKFYEIQVNATFNSLQSKSQAFFRQSNENIRKTLEAKESPWSLSIRGSVQKEKSKVNRFVGKFKFKSEKINTSNESRVFQRAEVSAQRASDFQKESKIE